MAGGAGSDDGEWISDRAVLAFVGGLGAVGLGAAIASALTPIPLVAAAAVLLGIWAATAGRTALAQAIDEPEESTVRTGVRPVRVAWLLRSLAIGILVIVLGMVALAVAFAAGR